MGETDDFSDQLHLIPVDQVVQMRPQFHHIDARMEQERSIRARDSAVGAPAAQARAIHMTVKSRVDGEDSTMDNMGERITAAQAEKWKAHTFIDEEDNRAWLTYDENMFVGSEYAAESTDELKKHLPELSSSLMNMEYMDTISAPNDFARLSRTRAQKKKKKGKGKGTVDGAEADDTSATDEEE